MNIENELFQLYKNGKLNSTYEGIIENKRIKCSELLDEGNEFKLIEELFNELIKANSFFKEFKTEKEIDYVFFELIFIKRFETSKRDMYIILHVNELIIFMNLKGMNHIILQIIQIFINRKYFSINEYKVLDNKFIYSNFKYLEQMKYILINYFKN